MVMEPSDLKLSDIKQLLNSSMRSYVKNSKLIQQKIASNYSTK